MRQRRLEDFAARRGDPRDGNVLYFRDSEYIAVHPFADDAALLERLAWPAQRCLAVDAYWKLYEDVVFFQVCAHSVVPRRAVGRYARRRQPDGGVNILIVVGAAAIDRVLFEGEMAGLLDSGAVARVVASGAALAGSLTPID